MTCRKRLGDFVGDRLHSAPASVCEFVANHGTCLPAVSYGGITWIEEYRLLIATSFAASRPSRPSVGGGDDSYSQKRPTIPTHGSWYATSLRGWRRSCGSGTTYIPRWSSSTQPLWITATLHGDNGPAAIGSAVGWEQPYHVTFNLSLTSGAAQTLDARDSLPLAAKEDGTTVAARLEGSVSP